MNRVLFSILFFGAAGMASPLKAADFKFQDQTLTVPEGFEVERVAGPPQVNRPIVADFDEQGRLYVADSSGSNDKVEKQLQDRPHRIVRLTAGKDGNHFDQSTIFADKMMFPAGILWHDGAVYCGAPPSIWKLQDTNNDGVADQRSEWFQGKTLTGCANDLHGPYLGLDGYIYWAKGAFAKQTHEREQRPTITDSAAHIFRCRPDGKDFDSLMSGGMDNPVDVVFTPDGDAIFTTTFYTNPEGGKRDALVHAIYGGVYPKVHGVLDGLKRTGPLMPALTHLGPAAPCGLTLYASKTFGMDYQGNLFSCQFNLHKVQRHVLEAYGATFRTRDIDFVTSDSPDFHPTDVIEDADGSLLVVDTGGWYKICCPTSQISKPDVLGAIYRVRRKNAPGPADPRGLRLNWSDVPAKELVTRLGDDRFAVRNRTMQQLAKMGDAAVPELKKALQRTPTPDLSRNITWTMTRIDSPTAREAVRSILKNANAPETQAAACSAGLWRDSKAVPQLIRLLRATNPHLQAAVATALGQIGDKSAAPALLELAGTNPDRFLEHAAIYALLSLGDGGALSKGLRSSNPGTHSAALVALDQTEGSLLKPESVIPVLNDPDPHLRGTALWLLEHHPEWGSHIDSWLKGQLAKDTAANAPELRKLLVTFASYPDIQENIGSTLANPQTSPGTKTMLLQVLPEMHLKSTPTSWTDALLASLQSSEQPVVEQAIAALRGLSLGKEASQKNKIEQALQSVSQRTELPLASRLNALITLPEKVPADPGSFALAREGLAPRQPPMVRMAAADALTKLQLNPAQLLTLCDDMQQAGPIEINRLLPVFEGNKTEEVGLKLVESLNKSAALPRLRLDQVKPRIDKFPATVQQAAAPLLARLQEGVAQQGTRLQNLAASLGTGDRNRGQRVFSSPKAACYNCHQIGYVGGKVGPDLSRIGSIRTERDLLESIIYPSASFVRSYEPMQIIGKDGEEYSGVLRSESSDSFLLVSGAGAEKRFSRDEIAEMRPGTLSVMPEGL
ncbi:MAG TPA: PVC-type heme-binding CxxCH protein, partial [Candidatus Saccharimonadales bacterium]|nr:PVC-type heme-binding CxxCH protein [Candidatus Saccharimonadales bacterium]